MAMWFLASALCVEALPDPSDLLIQEGWIRSDLFADRSTDEFSECPTVHRRRSSLRLRPAAAAVTASVVLIGPAVGASQSHIVGPGETLSALSQRFGIAVDELIQANHLDSADHIVIGQVLVVPSSATSTSTPAPGGYTVQAGDTLWSIASRYGTTVATLGSLNDIADTNALQVGQVVRLPSGAVPPGPSSSAATTAAAGAGPSSSSASSTGTSTVSYTVQAGDTLWSIATRLGTTVADLSSANGVSDSSLLQIGQVLRAPGVSGIAAAAAIPTAAPPTKDVAASGAGGSTYQVQSGDTLWSIATRFGTTVDALMKSNDMSDASFVRAGVALRLPANAKSSTSATPGASASVLPKELFGVSRAADPAYTSLVPLFDRWADANQLPRDLLKALTYLESGWNNTAVSSVGALGLGQLMPETTDFVNRALLGGMTLDPKVPEENIRLSARYLRYLLDLVGNENAALAGYYQGLGSVRRNGLYADTVQYVQNVQFLRRYFV